MRRGGEEEGGVYKRRNLGERRRGMKIQQQYRMKVSFSLFFFFFLSFLCSLQEDGKVQ